MKTKTKIIEEKAIELLKNKPQGMQTTELVNAIKVELPNFHPKTINGVVWKLPTTKPKEVYKPKRGLFRHVSFRENK